MDDLEQATTIKGYVHPKPKEINKFSVIDKTPDVETIIHRPDEYRYDEQEERERMMREIEAKYRPAQYEHSQKSVSSSKSVYSTLESLMGSPSYTKGRRARSMFWKKKADVNEYVHYEEDKSQVRCRIKYNYSAKPFRKHQMPLTISKGTEFMFSPNPDAFGRNVIQIILNEENVSISIFDDKISKEGYRDSPSVEGNKVFGTAITSPRRIEFVRRMRGFVPAVNN